MQIFVINLLKFVPNVSDLYNLLYLVDQLIYDLLGS